MTPLARWRVYASRFPLAAPTEVLSVVTARSQAEAEEKAHASHGPHVVVQRVPRRPHDRTSEENSR